MENDSIIEVIYGCEIENLVCIQDQLKMMKELLCLSLCYLEAKGSCHLHQLMRKQLVHSLNLLLTKLLVSRTIVTQKEGTYMPSFKPSYVRACYSAVMTTYLSGSSPSE